MKDYTVLELYEMWEKLDTIEQLELSRQIADKFIGVNND